MVEGNFSDLYFNNSDSNSEFKGFDPENIVPLWYWIFVQWHKNVWLYMNQSIYLYIWIVDMDLKKNVSIIICIQYLGMSIEANFNKLIQYLHVSMQKSNQCCEE